LKRKVESGADVVITQLTFSAENFCTFVKSCRMAGISEDIPIIPGLYIPRALEELDKILQITHAQIAQQFYDDLKNVANCEVKFQELGLTQTVTCMREIQRDCSEFVRGFHFYTMNNNFMLQRLTHAIDFSEISN
jgi:methylenetetrahydrofolate reductase (NADPH)